MFVFAEINLYNLNNGAYQSSNVFKNLKAGAYILTVKDANNCIINIPSTNITQPAAISIASTAKNVSCKNASDGSITVTAGKGTSPYQYSLNGGAYQSSNVFSGLPAGTYMVAVSDAKGCVAIAKNDVKIKSSNKACPMTFILNDDKSFDAKVYPNPTNNTFSLNLKGYGNSIVEIKLMDMYGKELLNVKGSVNHTYYFGENLAAGVYFIQVIHDSNAKTFKVIKQ